MSASSLGFPVRWSLAAIRFYQNWISIVLPNSCRFLPSCSEYTAMAIEEWGFWRGSLLGLRRIARCHPFGGSGLDNPPRKNPRRSEPAARQAGDLDG